MDVANMRESYERGNLGEEAASNAPLTQFEKWFLAAIKARVPEPNAMTVATVDANGRPATRIVLMKSFDALGVVFYTNYHSRKGVELAGNPHSALQFFWPALEQVIRIEGVVQRTTEQESDEYFAQRPLDSRIGAWASPQSREISSRAVLVANAAKASRRHGLKPPRPEWWGGYRLVPDYWEFWQGRKSRLHDRLSYTLEDGQWVRRRLAP